MPLLRSRLPLWYASKLTRLRPNDVMLLGRMSYLLAKVLALQSRLPLPELIARFDAGPSAGTPRPVPIRRLLALVDSLMRITLRDDYCMKRSLLLFHFLRRWGHDARIRFGVRKQDGELKGHAWVEMEGVPLAEVEDPRTTYATTYAYPPFPSAGDKAG